MREFPPRLPDQPIFYPVLTEAYATQIARDWNVPASGSGFVTRFDVLKSFLVPLQGRTCRQQGASGILDLRPKTSPISTGRLSARSR